MKASRWTPAFSHLLGGEALSALSGSAITLAIPVIAVTQLHADVFETAALAACVQSAPLLFGLSAGAIADRVNRRTALIWCNLTRAIILLIFAYAYVIAALPIWLLGVGGFALSCAQLLAEATMVAAIPSIVKRSQLTWGNGWFQAAGSMAQATGPASAGLALQWASLGLLFLATALAHIVSAVLFSKVQLPVDPHVEQDASGHMAQIRSGLAVIWRNSVQRAIALSSAAFNFFHAAFFALFPIYALDTLALSPGTLGILVSIAGLAGLGAALCAERLVNVLSVRVALIGSLFVVLPFSLFITLGVNAQFPLNVVMIVIAFAGWDFAVVLNIVIEQSIRQATLPAHLLSRASATQRFVTWGVDPLGALAGGAMALSPLGLFGSLNVSMWGMGAAGLILLLSPGVRALPPAFEDEPT